MNYLIWFAIAYNKDYHFKFQLKKGGKNVNVHAPMWMWASSPYVYVVYSDQVLE